MNVKIGSREIDVDEAIYDVSVDRWFMDPRYPNESGSKPINPLYFRELTEKIIETCSNSDQTAKSDSGKPKVSLVPFQIVYDIAEVREYGNAKYPKGGKDNWKSVDISRYRDALGRHVMAYLEDPDGKDAESGIEHYKHIACNMAFICWMEANKKGQNNE